MSEHHEELGWRHVGKMRAKEAGVRMGWGFGREWGTKRRVSEVGEGVAPEERRW